MSERLGSDARASGSIARFEIAGQARALRGVERCGDAWAAMPAGEAGVVLAVADGVGHGDAAHAASTRALALVRTLIAEDAARALTDVIARCHRDALGSVGLALLVLRAGPSGVELCGVGNVEVRSWPARESRGVSYAGTVGYRYRTTRAFTSTLERGDVLALTTDGVRSTFALSRPGASLPAYVESALDAHAREHDDATMVVVRHAED
ncbi:SpoIIE family protein phosphatase [Sandaracinus amylolyticus]|uniref:Phosphoserine phosphatase RsbX n=1 Tax=Sandaracinus amylolyticus TaxID=927083 RepID=A0A0F6W851_9BACT|nr:SpoIIE family protein phosphatase [Sandaracinus amylolyticus]AKF09912.1 Phosphoserine phosphatase RsbX [Sandaracinus amylolyticus]